MQILFLMDVHSKKTLMFHLGCDAKWCAAYLGISDIHLKDKLRISREEALTEQLKL